jgi:mannitol-1-phosphate/altronate dehydrogenase
MQLVKYEHQKLIVLNNDHAILTDEGMLLADGIASDLFIES